MLAAPAARLGSSYSDRAESQYQNGRGCGMRWQGEIDRPKHEPDAIDEAISSGYRTREIQGAGARDGTVSRKHDYDPLHHTEVVASDAARLNFDRVVFTFDAKARSARNYQRGEAAYKAKRDARLRLEAD